MKRTFIPPSHRPRVTGSQLNTEMRYQKILRNKGCRRKFIVDLMTGKQQLPDIDPFIVQKTLKEAFPHLLTNQKKPDES